MQGLFIKTDRICYQRTSIWPLAMTEMLLRCTGTWSKSSKLIIHEVKVILFMQHNHVIFGGGEKHLHNINIQCSHKNQLYNLFKWITFVLFINFKVEADECEHAVMGFNQN